MHGCGSSTLIYTVDAALVNTVNTSAASTSRSNLASASRAAAVDASLTPLWSLVKLRSNIAARSASRGGTTKPAPDSVSRSACHPPWLIMTGLPAASASKNLFAELFHNCGRSMTKDTATVVRARSAGTARFGRGGIIQRLWWSTRFDSARAWMNARIAPSPAIRNLSSGATRSAFAAMSTR